MMRHPRPLLGRGLRAAAVEAAVDLDGVGVDDLRPERFCQTKRKTRFADAGRSGDDDERPHYLRVFDMCVRSSSRWSTSRRCARQYIAPAGIVVRQTTQRFFTTAFAPVPRTRITRPAATRITPRASAFTITGTGTNAARSCSENVSWITYATMARSVTHNPRRSSVDDMVLDEFSGQRDARRASPRPPCRCG